MVSQVIDEEENNKEAASKNKKQLELLYKFEPGVAESSFGIMVAEKAGLFP